MKRQRRFSLASEGDAEGSEAPCDRTAACRLMQLAKASAQTHPRVSEALDAPGWVGAALLPGETPCAVEAKDKPDMLAASSWQSAGSEYAFGEFMTNTLKATTRHNARSLSAINKLIIGSWPVWRFVLFGNA